MQFSIKNEHGIYLGKVDAIPATPPDVGWYAPKDVIICQNEPPTDELDKWIEEDGIWKEITLEGIKRYAKAQLKSYRQKIESGGFYFLGYRWDSELKDEMRLNSAKTLFEAGVVEVDGWKISDEVYITLTPSILAEVVLAFMQHTGTAFAIEQIKITEIDNLQDIPSVIEWIETKLKESWNLNEPVEV